jgi:hypothetical protein
VNQMAATGATQACQRIPLPSGKIFSTQMDTALGCSLNQLGFYSLRKETASVKAAESISFPGTCGESVV